MSTYERVGLDDEEIAVPEVVQSSSNSLIVKLLAALLLTNFVVIWFVTRPAPPVPLPSETNTSPREIDSYSQTRTSHRESQVEAPHYAPQTQQTAQTETAQSPQQVATTPETEAPPLDWSNCFWRQTGECDPKGKREPDNDVKCDGRVPGGASGFCDCPNQIVIPYKCNHHSFTCKSECSKKLGIAQAVSSNPAASAVITVPETAVAMIPRPIGCKLDIEKFLNKYAPLNIVDEHCDKTVGDDYVRQWIRNKVTFCAPKSDSASKITCFPRTDISVPLTLCYTHHSLLPDSNAFAGIKQAEPNTYFVENCEKDSNAVPDAVFGTTPKKWFVQGLEVQSTPLKCDHVIEHPVYFLDRYDTGNLYHASEDFVTTFINLAMIQISEKHLYEEIMKMGLEFVIVDDCNNGYFMDFWRSVGTKVRDLRTDPFPANTCFKTSIHNVHGGVSMLSFTNLAQSDHCTSSIIQSYSEWIRTVFQPLQSPFAAEVQQQNQENRVHKVVWASRSRFEHSQDLSGNPWANSRVIDNEDEIVLFLQQRILDHNKESCVYKRTPCTEPGDRSFFTLETMEFSDLNFMQQLQDIMTTDILIGVHGAGMAHVLHMPPRRSALIELRPPAQQGSFHFQHLGSWLGGFYRSVDYPQGHVSVDALGSAFDDAVSFIKQLD